MQLYIHEIANTLKLFYTNWTLWRDTNELYMDDYIMSREKMKYSVLHMASICMVILALLITSCTPKEESTRFKVMGTDSLDDITVTQVSTVSELRMAEPNMSRAQLIGAGIRIGRAHIASTVNTLVLAYVGAAMPLLLIFDATRQTLGLAANSESIAIEIVRTLCGSIGLVAAVPLTTALAATLVSHSPAPSPDGEAGDEPRRPSWDDFAPEDSTELD